MSDHQIDALVAASAVIDDAEVAALPLAGAKAELMEEIMSAPPQERLAEVTPLHHDTVADGRRSRRRRLLALVAAAAVAVTGVVVQPFRDHGTAWAAELVEIAESAPRLLIAGGDWTVVRADEFRSDLGEMTFSDGERQVDVHWRAPDDHEGRILDRVSTADLVRSLDVLGHPATLARYDGTNDYTTHWLQGDHSIEVRGVFPTVDDYLAVLGLLETVDVDTWLSAMPASVVSPDETTAVIGEMLEGIPLPEGFDIAAIGVDGILADRYQLGARVSGSVACAWIGQWVDATATRDESAAREAVAAMATSTAWPILLEMEPAGGYSDEVWMYAAAIASDGTVVGGEVLSVAETYPDALGCDL